MADRYEVMFKGDEIYLPEEVQNYFNQVRALNKMIKDLESQKEEIEKPLKAAMLKHGIEKFQCKYMTASIAKGANYYVYDTEAMRRDGVLDKYATQKKRADSVRIYYRKADEDNEI